VREAIGKHHMRKKKDAIITEKRKLEGSNSWRRKKKGGLLERVNEVCGWY